MNIITMWTDFGTFVIMRRRLLLRLLPCWPVSSESLSHKLSVLAQSFYTPPQSKPTALLSERTSVCVSVSQTRRGLHTGTGQSGASPLAAFTLNLSLLKASSVLKSHFTSSYKAYRDKRSTFRISHHFLFY